MKFEEVFSFVRNKVLKDHLADALETSVELSTIADQYPEPTRSIFYKTAIIYLASIIEAVIHNCVLELGHESYSSDWHYRDVSVLHELGDKESTQVIAGKRIKKSLPLEGYVDFAVLNKYCRNFAKIYDKELYGEIDRVRKLRNKIHLKNLSEIDRKFSKKDVDKIAEIANKVLDAVEKKQRKN